jgi:hypothetical protein
LLLRNFTRKVIPERAPVVVKVLIHIASLIRKGRRITMNIKTAKKVNVKTKKVKMAKRKSENSNAGALGGGLPSLLKLAICSSCTPELLSWRHQLYGLRIKVARVFGRVAIFKCRFGRFWNFEVHSY